MIKSNAWVDRFQPQTIEQCFLPEKTRNHLNVILKTGEVPSMFFSGPPGIGKTTVARAICEQLDLEYLFINASLHGNIDTIRNDIQVFSSSLSFNGKRKVVILDEADWITAAAQASLRGVINEFADNVAFILTSNIRSKVIEPLISRLTEVDFLFSKAELPQLARSLYNFIVERLNEENVQYEPKAVQEFLKNRLMKSTDIRKTLIIAQKISMTGTFDVNSLIDVNDIRLEELVEGIKAKNFNTIRTWVGENSDIDASIVFRYIYDNVNAIVPERHIPNLVMLIAQYQHMHVNVIDKEINLAAFAAEVSVML